MMDFSSSLSKHINEKRKSAKPSKSKSKRLKLDQSGPVVNQKEKKQSSPEVEIEKVEIKDDELSEEQLNSKLTQFNELDESLSRDDKIKKLTYLLQQQVKNTKYKSWLDKEAEYYQDQQSQIITTESIRDIHSSKESVCLKLRVYLKSLLSDWQSKHPDDPRLEETKIGILKLLYKLRSGKLSDEMLVSVSTVVHYMQLKNINKANESYMKLSIGNVCWPIGMVNVGIHSRTKTNQVASNIMIKESTRKWILSLKRLIGYVEREMEH